MVRQELKNETISKNTDNSSNNKEVFLKRKEIDKEIRKTEKIHAEIENKIEELEKFIKECEDRLSDGEKINEKDFWIKFENAKRETDEKMLLWDELTQKITELSEKKEKL